MKLARAVRLARDAGRDLEEARKVLIQRYGKDDAIDPSSPNWSAFLREYVDLLSTDVPVDLPQFDQGDFNLDENAIPFGILARLDPIINAET